MPVLRSAHTGPASTACALGPGPLVSFQGQRRGTAQPPAGAATPCEMPVGRQACASGCTAPVESAGLRRSSSPIFQTNRPESNPPEARPMKDRENTGTADQRRTHRRALEAQVSMRLETSTLNGQSDNISRAGLLFYSDQPIRVSVEVAEVGGPRT